MGGRPSRLPGEEVNVATSRPSKRCNRCDRIYDSRAFAADKSAIGGRQSWCRRCKVEWESGPHGAWRRFAAFLRKHEPRCLDLPRGWTEELYVTRWAACGGICELCGADLSEWQKSGHRLDRIDNGTPHIPNNCRFLCWPCNRHKSDRNPHVADQEIRMWVEQYGRGRVPWQTIQSKAGRVELPDLAEFVVEIQLSLLGGPR
jgi:5-methylcytosine-specific restriction endonuclease McrA